MADLYPLLQSRHLHTVVVMPAYNAACTLESTYSAIPKWCVDDILLVDDDSRDSTSEVAARIGVRVIRHPKNMGYGGNQKTCYDTALAMGADVIVMLHPDNQYNPKIIPNLLLPIILDQADVVLASRFIADPLNGGPIAGGMPRYKYYLNMLLTYIQNGLMGTYFSEFHTGYRAYSAQVLRKIAYRHFDDGFVFDNQMLAACVALRLRIAQIAVQTRYFPAASSIGLMRGFVYACKCLGIGARYYLHRKGVRWPWLAMVCGDSPPVASVRESDL